MTIEKNIPFVSFLPFFFKNKNNSYFLPLKEIHVWCANIDYQRDGFLAPAELVSARNKGSILVRKRFENSRKIARELLSKYLHCSPETIFFKKEVLGKPFVANFPEISFSVTHSGAVMLLAVSRNHVGVDVELIRPVNAFSIAEKFFSPEECQFLKKENSEKKAHVQQPGACPTREVSHLDKRVQKRFFQLWTAKEATLKADGRGITRGLRSAFATIKNNKVTSIHLFEEQLAIYSRCFKTFNAKAEHHFIASVASPSPDALIRWYDLN